MKNRLHQISFGFLFLRSFVKRYYLYVLLGLFLGFSVFWVWVNFNSVFFKQTPSEKVGYVGNFTENTLPTEIETKISYGLFELDKNKVPKKALVEEYKIKDGGKTYWFKIKEGLKWQDGTDFKTEDIRYDFKDVEKKVINDYELEYRLKEPYGPFLTLLASPLFKNKRLVGLGKYEVVEINKSGSFINELIIQRYNIEKGRKGKVIDRIEYRFYPQEDTMVTGFKLGEINEARGLTNVYGLDSWPNIEVEENVDFNSWVGIFFNQRRSILAEKDFRQALFYAIESFKFSEPKVYSPISSENWAYTKNIKSYSYSPADSQRLLEKLDEGKIGKEKITLIAVKPYDKYLEDVAQSWEKMGINVKTYRSSVIPGNFDALITAFKVPDDPDQYYFWHSTSRGNFINFNSPRIDKILEDGRLEYRTKQRKEIYSDFQKYFMEEAPVSLLYYPVSFTLKRV